MEEESAFILPLLDPLPSLYQLIGHQNHPPLNPPNSLNPTPLHRSILNY